MSITVKLLTSGQLSFQDMITLVSYYTKEPTSISDGEFEKFVCTIDWSEYSFFESYHLLAVIISLCSKKNISTSPYIEISSLFKYPTELHAFKLLRLDSFLKMPDNFKLSTLAIADTIPNFWSNTKSSKLHILSEVLQLRNYSWEMMNALLEGPSFYESIHEMKVLNYSLSTDDIMFV